MDFLKLADKNIVVFGLANKKSVACAIAQVLTEAGANLIQVVRSDERAKTARKLFPESAVFCCDVEDEANIVRVRDEIAAHLAGAPVHGIAHSIAFANYSAGIQPFHATPKADFLQAMDISCFSFISIANHFRELLAKDAALVTISISTTRMAAENYGYMAPVKAALESSLCFLAKSFSAFSEVRFNSSDANIHGSINKDETLAYKLVPGPHKITFRYGKYQETFVIVILDSGEPVKITYKGASGGSNNHYVIDQPYAGEAYKDLVNGKFPSEVTPLSVVALILSLTVILSFWGFILGIIDLGVSKNQGKKPSTTAVMAVTFGSIFMFIGLPMMISCVA